MEEYRLNLGRGDLSRVGNYADLMSLVDRVLIVDIINNDPKPKSSKERVIDGIKLAGLILRNNPPTVFGVRFKEDSRGEHLICGERYKKLDYSPEELVLNADDFCLRDVHVLSNSDMEYPVSHIVKGIIEGL